MRTLLVCSQKGGVGKTTLATAIAVAADAAGRHTILFDLDPQGSAAFWKDARQAPGPEVVSVQPVRLRHMLKSAAEAGVDLVVIDAPPIVKDIAFQAAEHSDFVLIPTKPAILDIMATTETIKIIKKASDVPKPYAVIMSVCPFQGRELSDTEDAIKRYGAMIAPVRMYNRVAHSRAQQTGRTAQEFEPDGKAALEIKQLYTFVCKHLFKKEVANAA